MDWTVAEARRSFSELLKQAKTAPQLVFRRHEHVAAVVDPDTFQEFLDWLHRRNSRSVEDAFSELRAICEGGMVFPERSDRPNAFAEMLDELPD